MSQALALFVKATRKLVKRLQDIQKAALSEEMDGAPASRALENGTTRADGEEGESAVNEDEEQTGVTSKSNAQEPDKMAVDETPEQRAFREKQRELISSLDLSK